jgi:murein DD-endopeptidase MepM/ murein hydrolase activator NlpD
LIVNRVRYAAVVLGLLAALASSAPVATAVSPAGSFIWPTTGRETQPFGCTGFWAEPPRGSCDHFHVGVDIANARGTPIHAAADGVIAIVGWDPWIRIDPDWLVVIDHAGGFRTLYAHMRAKPLAGITKGAHVVQGQLIGYMDMTGHATGPHLHWGVYLNGTPVDPMQYVTGALERGAPPHRLGVTAASACTRQIALEPGGPTAMVLEGDLPNAPCAA